MKEKLWKTTRKKPAWLRKRREMVEEAKKGNLKAQKYCHFQLHIGVLFNGSREIDLKSKFKGESGVEWRIQNLTTGDTIVEGRKKGHG